MIVEMGVLRHWLRTAQKGETLTYARATCLPAGSAVAKLLRELAEAEQVVLVRKRREHGPGDENFAFLAKRTAKALPDALSGMRTVRAVRAPTPAPAKPQDRRFGAASATARDIAPQVRALIAEGMRPSAGAIARTLGVYGEGPVRLVLERMAA